MTRSIMVGEVRTGRRITQIPVESASWSMEHRGIGTVRATIPLAASDFAALERRYVGGLFPGSTVWPSPTTYPQEATPVWRPGDGLRPEFLAALDPVRCFLAVLEDDVVLEAGPIWTWDYDDATARLTVNAANIRSLFDHRYVMGVVSSGYATWTATYSGLSLGTHVKRLVELAMAHTGGDLPINLPADVMGSHERTYHGYDFATVEARISEIEGVDGGPDVAFRPRLSDDRLGIEWDLVTGTDADPLLHQAGGDHVFDARAVRGSVGAVSVQRDGTGLAQRSWMTGAGMEDALLVARREPSQVGAIDLRNNGYPLTETVEARHTVDRQATADSWAASNLRGALRPWQTWTAQVRADGSPRLGTYRPGDWCTVHVRPDHPLLSLLRPDGTWRARILGISGDVGDVVSVRFAPEMEAR